MNLNKIIAIVREEMMAANPPGGSGGFSGSSNPKGPTAGFDPVMKKMTRRKNTIGLWAGSLKKKRKKK
jgi:hypothetical protein|tara:strand:- start:110 stop:313 length:204 start_codon:yes stop_codon:yes gene_type:complete